MPDEIRCPSCGRSNPAGAEACRECNFPLLVPAAEPADAPATEPAAPDAAPQGRDFDPTIRPMRPIRPRRPDPQQKLQLQLWLVLGGLALMLVLYTAWDGFRKNNPPAPPVEGAKEDQQKLADAARAAIARDSTNVNAQIALANVLYDTANWSEAIVHYAAASRLDSTRAETFVDEGVCYYNLSNASEAVALFRRALALDPHQPVALFNLGVVVESQGLNQEALQFYHQALQSSPPENMKQPLLEAMKRVSQKVGTPAPPLPGAGGGTP